ncbi:MAG TPA: enoyl-CoA hydratase/isomerase family protein [Syntrophales bacterium]|nr:enoyl-CoA hydratase/isomerase family protein [Syntrophales bacterium]HPX12298.1 enoyl-CoA hydratase/isomerase family protein [Syntrophales bacterium]HQN78552.1 enoyl-CoA hydratase/isomerase family protein [Syntrophales bacterium]HQQ27438.1 enoyl-CoA hydratase/isomerase family protein [Syntrophales bacterium]
MAVLEWKKEGTVAVLTMTNGENRHNLVFVGEMLEALDAIERDKETTSVVIVSGDAKNWSQGIDLAWLAGRKNKGDLDSIREFLYGMNRIFRRILLYPMPVIACINGHAAANGAILSCACDFRFMRGDRGFFFFPEVNINIPFFPGMLGFLRKAIPPYKFNEMALTGNRYGAADLAAHNVFVKVCNGEEELKAETMAFAASMQKGRGVFGEMKKRMHREIIETMDREDPKIIEPLFIVME